LQFGLKRAQILSSLPSLSSQGASLFLTISIEGCDYHGLSLVNNNNPHNEHHQLHQDSISQSTEVIIQRTVEGIQKLLNPQHGNTTLEEEAAAVIKINPVMKRHWELEIKTLQDAPRDADKLRAVSFRRVYFVFIAADTLPSLS
jgi:hypothetical protein